MSILVDATEVSAARPGRPLFERLSLTISTGDRLGVVGINGGGKSTLLRVLAGTESPESGSVRFGKGVRVGHLEQRPELDGTTVHEAAGGTWSSDAVLDRLGMGGLVDRPVSELSGGQAKRVALAAALTGEHDLLVLDEPTNHLDLDATVWLEDRLSTFTGGLVLVSHDRHLLDRLTTRMLELDRGSAHLHEGGYAAYLDAVEERAGRAESAERARRNLARRELAWLRRGAPARTSKPKARIATATAVVNARAQAPARSGAIDFAVDTPRLGDVVVELHGADAWRGERQVLHDVELLLDPRERLGVVGPNGAGKSTLLGLLSGRLEPRGGHRVEGSTVRLALFDQHGAELHPGRTVRETVVGPHREPDHRDVALMESFWFDGDAQWAPVGLLSGGERRRLQLVVTLATRPNVLLLDEPTNDLDLDTLRALEDFLEEWPGAAVVVSHDRAFLERVVADVVVIEDGVVARRPGGFGAYEAERLGRKIRGRVASASSEESAAPAPRRRPASPRSAGRSPAHLRNLLREATRRTEALTAERQQLLEQLSSPGGHEVAAAAGNRMAALEEELAAAEERWLELAAEAEERGLELP